MKKFYLLIFLLSTYFNTYSQTKFGYKKVFHSVGFTGKYLTAEKYTGYDFNLTYVPRYNFLEINGENTLSVELRPQIGIGTRDWYIYGEYETTFPTRFSYSIPIFFNYNWGLNAEEDSDYILGFYLGGGYNYANVYSKTPPYEAIHGPAFDFGLRFDGAPVSNISFMYTYGLNGGKIYSVSFLYDF